MSNCNVKVVVRARPLNRKNENKCILSMTKTSATISVTKRGPLFQSSDQPTTSNEMKTFNYDRCYWSNESNDANFSTQQDVFEDIGMDVLENSLDGYNSCIFAYGQTGSGKSYSMMGTEENPGLIPRIMEALFEKINSWDDPRDTFTAEVSYMEIYNERVRDLLNLSTKNFRVREHPSKGPYVEGLSSHIVRSYKDVERLFQIGNESRTVAQTAMNDKSSRSHALFTVVLTKKKFEPELGLFHSRISKINLIDLAGSERVSVSQTSGQRLKEGASINKSLTSLGLVIKALVEKSQSEKKIFVPYRDSVLTYLLKECLGGNSKTIMLATVSPADVHEEETLSTLRYADSTKKIVNKAVVNDDPKSKIIQELLAEVQLLKQQLALYNGQTEKPDFSQYEIEIERPRKQLEDRDNDIQSLRMRSVDSANTEPLKENEVQFEKVEEEEVVKHTKEKIQEKDLHNLPHLVNLNDDPVYSSVLIHYVKKQITTIGTSMDCDIVLNGDFVNSIHCTLEMVDGKAYISPYDESSMSMLPSPDEDIMKLSQMDLTNDSPGSHALYLNGERIYGRSRLKHGSRVLIGRSHIFRFNHPEEAYAIRQKRLSEISSHSSIPSSGLSLSFDDMPASSSLRDSSFVRNHQLSFVSTVSTNNDNDEEEISRLRQSMPQHPKDEEMLTRINIQIPHVEFVEDEKPYHIYHVYITIDGVSWHVARRYSQFLSFHKQAQKHLPTSISNAFPYYSVAESIANFVGTPMKAVDKRRKRLEVYMNSIVNWWLTEWRSQNRPVDVEVIQRQIPILCPNGVLDAYTGIWIQLEGDGPKEDNQRYSADDDTIQLPDLHYIRK